MTRIVPSWIGWLTIACALGVSWAVWSSPFPVQATQPPNGYTPIIYIYEAHKVVDVHVFVKRDSLAECDQLAVNITKVLMDDPTTLDLTDKESFVVNCVPVPPESVTKHVGEKTT